MAETLNMPLNQSIDDDSQDKTTYYISKTTRISLGMVSLANRDKYVYIYI